MENQLSKIPKWSQEVIDQEYNRIVSQSQCDWIEDLLTAVFVSHTKILSVVHMKKRSKKINLKIPKADHFIHKCYIESAREFWKNPYLYSDRVSQFEYQRNMRECEGIIAEAIHETIRKLLPVKHILREYLGTDYSDEDGNSSDEVTKDVSKSYRNNLKKIVQREIESCTKVKKSQEEKLKELIRQELSSQDKESSSEELLDKITENTENTENTDTVNTEDAKPEEKSEAKSETKSEAKSETKSETKSEEKSEEKSESKSET